VNVHAHVWGGVIAMIGDTYRFKVGAFDCLIICDIDEHFPAAQIFSTVPVE
jgi:hypothetical protein